MQRRVAGVDAAAELRRLCAAAQRDGAEFGGPANVMLVLTGVRRAARIEDLRPGSALEAAVRALVKRFPRRLAVLRWGPKAASEPLVLAPALVRTPDARTLARLDGSDLAEPASGAMGRLLGYRCRYEAAPLSRAHEVGPWKAHGFVELQARFMRDGVEMPAVYLAGFGCGPSVTRASFRRRAQQAVAAWEVAGNRALAGTGFRLGSHSWLLTRFVVHVQERAPEVGQRKR